MSCCDHGGYDGDWYHEYCCRCSTEEERALEIIEDVLAGDWKGEDKLPESMPAAIWTALKIEGVVG